MSETFFDKAAIKAAQAFSAEVPTGDAADLVPLGIRAALLAFLEAIREPPLDMRVQAGSAELDIGGENASIGSAAAEEAWQSIIDQLVAEGERETKRPHPASP